MIQLEHAKAFFLYKSSLKVCDALVVLLVWFASWQVRFYSEWIPVTKGIPEFSQYSKVAFPLVLVFVALFHIVGAYRSDRIHFGFRSLKKNVQGTLLGTLVFVSILYFLGQAHYSRIFLLVFLFFTLFALIAERGLMHFFWLQAERRWIRKIRILLIGYGELIEMFVSQLERLKPYPLVWVGWFGNGDVPFPGARLRKLGSENEIESRLPQLEIDRAVISYPPGSETQYARLLPILANEMINTTILPDFGRESTFAYKAEHECGIPLLTINQAPLSVTDRLMKRLFDILGSALFLTVFSPLYFAIALIIKLSSWKDPVFYSQKRMGADGKIFPCYKFRTMKPEAETRTGPVWAVPDDERTTAFGKWLRKCTLDEMPQFFNVLKGDMSIVGPRPERPHFVRQFRSEVPRYMLRHKMKSGITGWAQINGWRGNTSIEERIKHDLYYIGHWSHWFDLKIIALTPFRGLINKNAY